jgi:hypothetical protein
MLTLQQRLQAAKAQLLLQGPRIVLTQAQSALALVTLRIQREGLPGQTYSTNPVPKFWLKPTNAAGRAYVKREKKPTYAGLRGAQGMETRFVNVTYTGRTIRSLTVAPAGATRLIYAARIVSSDHQSAKIIGHLVTRYGKFLAPNSQEQQQLQGYVRGEVKRIIQQALQG